ncbi:nucleophile aminohydrolase [Zychaea mexicana]|uniref:nucleophile aminohydrolase n=1 Tax=Zychaea mexicana TaxID=64656 RepID=UPI0022FE444C|nr:nucleophile aminohydrolase [Zychaea mexicana]KAI9489640.1 nucleophile aminohydrolase [Zychaea mexicana]
MSVDTVFPFASRRSVVYGTNGMVASSQPLATQAGIDILKKGGNAADAAIAVSAALGVTEPASTGIGGDAVYMFYNARTRKVTGINGTGRAPAAITAKYLREQVGIEHPSLPEHSIHAITVPGAAAAWVDTVEHHGSGRLDMAAILESSINLAENGFPVSYISAGMWEVQIDITKKMSGPESPLLLDGTRAPAEGELMRFPDLADTYKAIAAQGKDGFYKGRIADAIVNAIKSRGGLMTQQDLASHTSEFINEPISMDYHDKTIWEMPPNTQGITTLIALGIIKALEEEHGLEISKLEHNSAEYLHVIIEVMRLAFADARYYVSDPQVMADAVPTKKLLSKAYLSERARLVDMKKRNNTVQKGYPERNSDTVYFSVVDAEGNACSALNSTFSVFGSKVVPDKCGFPLHNRGCTFVLDESLPNCIGPRKRPHHTLIPSMVTRKTTNGDHELAACLGIMGGYVQPQGQLQFIMSLMHFLANPQHAVDVPRICVAPPRTKENTPNFELTPNARIFLDLTSSIVCVEEGIPQKVIDELEAMGHVCEVIGGHERAFFGRGQIILVKRDRSTGQQILAGGSDPRGDGHAVGISGSVSRPSKL